MSYISGSRKALVAMLQDAFECGFEAGFHCEDNPGDPHADWLDYYYTIVASSLAEEVGLTDEEETKRSAYEAEDEDSYFGQN